MRPLWLDTSQVSHGSLCWFNPRVVRPYLALAGAPLNILNHTLECQRTRGYHVSMFPFRNSLFVRALFGSAGDLRPAPCDHRFICGIFGLGTKYCLVQWWDLFVTLVSCWSTPSEKVQLALELHGEHPMSNCS